MPENINITLSSGDPMALADKRDKPEATKFY